MFRCSWSLKLALCLCLFVVGPGCSLDVRELDEVSIVMATGIDWDANTNKHRIIVYALQPASKGSSAQSNGLMEWLGAGNGNSVMESAQSLRNRASKKLFWFHNRIFVIGKEAAQHSLPEIVDFLQRNREIRNTSLMLVSDGTAEQMLKVRPETKDLLVNELFGMIRNQDETGKSLGISVKDMINRNANATQGFLTGRLVAYQPKEKSEDVLALEGTSILRNGKFIGWLNSEETAVARLLTDRDTDKVQFTCVIKDGAKPFGAITSLSTIKSRSIRPYFVRNRPHIDIDFDLLCQINEIANKHTLSQQDISTLEQHIETYVQQQVTAIIKKAQQQTRVDYLGFSEQFYKHHPTKWNQLKSNWDDVFATMPVHVNVDLTIWNTGTID
ncbi:Ger(x)C family spore germination protein [Paenibacillus sp. 481]|uniref:Ger(x)C family spore germination protein n=1 Tax=Paenibacillus sp. 481 TaxID=2835869 RepID=UPI001E460438|nr:Ger(x)C family spore germination protein [Paenibacillus sp. 481]